MKFRPEQWKKYTINELFDVSLSKGDIKLDEVNAGDIPLISAGEADNGVVGYISSEGDGIANIFSGNLITVDMFCHAFYQKREFYSVSHGRVNILTPKFDMTELVALFICTLIDKEAYKYSYGRAVYSGEIDRMEIRLPSLKNGDPNWKYIEEYMKGIIQQTVDKTNKRFSEILKCK